VPLVVGLGGEASIPSAIQQAADRGSITRDESIHVRYGEERRGWGWDGARRTSSPAVQQMDEQ